MRFLDNIYTEIYARATSLTAPHADYNTDARLFASTND